MSKVSVIGSGFSGLSAAAFLAKKGLDVQIIEKNSTVGGRARQFKASGFTFDMGPSWYWMPDVFESFYNKFGYTTSDFYDLKRLDPGYQIFFEDGDVLALPANLSEVYTLFENREAGSSIKLKKFLKSAKYKYDVGINEYVYKPGASLLEYVDLKVLKSMFKLNMLSSLSSEVRSLFKDPKLLQLLEFPVLFLGAMPDKIPALYSLMNYADINLGTWYPMGGMFEIVKAMEKICVEQGVEIHLDSPVVECNFQNSDISSLILKNGESISSDTFVCSADYHFFDQKVLPQSYQSYSSDYWEGRSMAPSSLLFYLGIDKKIEALEHHNLFFDADFSRHAREIYEDVSWPDDPLFYVCNPSATDESVAPIGMENLFILIPLASGLDDSLDKQNTLFDLVCDRLAFRTDCDIRSHIVYKKVFSVDDFKSDYNAFKGNAYGLANTLIQTGFLKPKMKSKKLNNLFYTGQLTTPGPGVPPSIISGEVVAGELIKSLS